MAGCRSLSTREERRLLRVVRRLPIRNRALLTAQWFSGFRISEVLSLRVGSVWREGRWLPSVRVRPSHLKGHFGRTRYVPILPELRRALEALLPWLEKIYGLHPDLPLFPSRNHPGGLRAISRVQAAMIFRAAYAAAGVEDDGRLGTHVMRKSFAHHVYNKSGHDLLVLKSALGHRDISVTERYLEVSEAAVAKAIEAIDFTRAPRKRPAPSAPLTMSETLPVRPRRQAA